MDKTEKIVRHAEVSEKAIERYLCRRVKEMGGVCLKYSNPGATGYPDRVAVMPDGRTAWFELKSLGRHTTKIQEIRIRELRRLGHAAYVCDSRESIDEALEGLAG